jgi:hypothetical protein
MMIFIRKYGLWAVLFFCLFLTSLPARDLPGERESHVSELILRAEREKLHEDPYWLLLLHYKRGIAGWRSLIDDPAFFFSPEGKRNSRKEMEATIRAFFSESAGTAIHPAMKFIARYSWLKERLNINESLMALNPVEKFNSYYDSLKLSRVILVFPSGYMGSPASMYGHTLILLEPQNGSRLLSMAVNYAANTEESFGPAFIYRGVFGLYDGFYSFLPYHEKINEYSFGEMRDMWEYRLNLDEGEKRRLVMHLIELEHMKSGYFFFDENCSYNLLFLIEVARPSTAITERFSVPVEPVDTIRAVIDSGLVEKKDYRPSLYSKIRYRADTLDSECDKRPSAGQSDEAVIFQRSEEAAMTLVWPWNPSVPGV